MYFKFLDTVQVPRMFILQLVIFLHKNNAIYSSSWGFDGSSSPPGGGISPPLYSLLVIGYATLLSFSFCSSKSSEVAVAAFSSNQSVASLTASNSCHDNISKRVNG